MKSNNKINWLLILQGWAMLLVVLGHVTTGLPKPGWAQMVKDFAYSFHMPLFMLISGWLFYLTRLKSGGGDWPYNKIVKDKALRLLIPGLVFSIVAFAVKIAIPGEMSRQTDLTFTEILHAYLFPFDNPLRELWFIATLFWFFIFTPFWKFLLSKKWITYFSVAVLTVLHFFHPSIEFLCIDRVFRFAIWFFLGIVISKEDVVDNLFARHPWLTLLCGVLIYWIGWYIIPFVTTLGGIVFSFAFALIADKYIPKLFFSFRNYTYQIFLIGIFAQVFARILFKNLPVPYVVLFLLNAIMGIYVPVLISILFERLNLKPLLLCVGLKPRKKESK